MFDSEQTLERYQQSIVLGVTRYPLEGGRDDGDLDDLRGRRQWERERDGAGGGALVKQQVQKQQKAAKAQAQKQAKAGAAGAPHGDGVPELRPLPDDDGGGECGVRPAGEKGRES